MYQIHIELQRILREGNILGILQCFYAIIFGIFAHIFYFLDISYLSKGIFLLLVYILINIYIYIYRESILKKTTEFLVTFLSSYRIQKYLFSMATIESYIFKEKINGMLLAFFLSLLFGKVILGIMFCESYMYYIYLGIFYLIFFWWRFRITFFNRKMLSVGMVLQSKVYIIPWSKVIYRMNKVIAQKNGLYRKIPDMLALNNYGNYIPRQNVHTPSGVNILAPNSSMAALAIYMMENNHKTAGVVLVGGAGIVVAGMSMKREEILLKNKQHVAEIEVKIAEINLREKQYLFDQFKFLNDEKKELVILKKKASWFQSKEITNIEKDILITLDNRLLSTQQEMSKLTSYTDELRNIGKESQPLKITSSSLEMIVSLF